MKKLILFLLLGIGSVGAKAQVKNDTISLIFTSGALDSLYMDLGHSRQIIENQQFMYQGDAKLITGIIDRLMLKIRTDYILYLEQKKKKEKNK